MKEGFRKGLPRHLRITLLLATCGMVGASAAVSLSLSLPPSYVKIYIGSMITLVGLFILAALRANFKFSWRKVTLLGMVASFNKGISGGGYGPLVTSGQVLSGVDGKNAIGITSLAEGLTCLTGGLWYFNAETPMDWSLASYLILGAVLSVPLASHTVRAMCAEKLKIIIGAVSVTIGIFTLYKALMV